MVLVLFEFYNTRNLHQLFGLLKLVQMMGLMYKYYANSFSNSAPEFDFNRVESRKHLLKSTIR
jgi:hypothetical protein